MRRSAAPSQLGGPSKRPRFAPPVLKQDLPECQAKGLPEPVQISAASAAAERSARDILKLINNKTKLPEPEKPAAIQRAGPTQLSYQNELNEHNPEPNNEDTACFPGNLGQSQWQHTASQQPAPYPDQSHLNIDSVDSLAGGDENVEESTAINAPSAKYKPSFKSFRPTGGQTAQSNGPNENKNTLPSKGYKRPVVDSPANSQQTPASTVEAQSLYFAVMWCKKSARKHKKWEGDAILKVGGRSVTLTDMEGKDIGKATGYKCSELQALDEGSTLGIGGKEIEVMNKISEVEYNSGKCFQDATQSSPVAETNIPKALSKPFRKPQKPGPDMGANTQVNEQGVSVKPRFDPTSHNALVMPRPSQAHQWEYNTSKLPLVDIVVDPYVSQHLRPHQREGVVFLYQCVTGMRSHKGSGAILADEMGLGKTLQCIALIWTLFKQGPYGGKPLLKRVLVITPGSLVKNWCQEFKKWLGNERLKVFGVSPTSRVEEFIHTPTVPVMVVSYEMFVKTIDLVRGVKFDLVVCDEGHRLKNTTIKTTTFVNSLSCPRRVMLTGTPVQNDLQELYSIVDLCNPGILGSANGFKRVYEDPILRSRQPAADPAEVSLGENRAAELNRITSLFILRRTSDINNKYLPPKVEMVLFCQPSELQVRLYKKLLTSRIVKSCMMSMDAAQHLMCISALKKLCNHPVLIHKNAEETEAQNLHHEELEAQLYHGLLDLYPPDFLPASADIEHSGKLVVVDGLLQSFNQAVPQERVVLVSNYTQTLDLLEQLCQSRSYPFLRLDGQTPTAKRQALVERFNNKYATDFVFLLSSKAGGVGLNLIGASRLILYDVDWNPANDLQAMARVWRDGQRRQVHIYRLLITGSLEEKIYQRQISKQGLSGVVVDARINTKQSFSPDELKDLFKLDEQTLCATHDLLNCDCETGDKKAPDEQEITEVVRSCQLQPSRKAKQNKKNLAMDELLEWNHIAGPEPFLGDVDPLLGSLENVTYAFWNVSNSQESGK